LNSSKSTPRYLINKLSKVKDENILNGARRKTANAYLCPICLTTDFLKETMQARRKWHDISQYRKKTNYYLRGLYPAKLSFNNSEWLATVIPVTEEQRQGG
jgi:hypothetical protein